MHVSYLYSGAIPSRRAAFIQILNTSRALCERDVPVTVYADAVTAPTTAEALAFYGLEPHALLRIERLPLTGRRNRLLLPARLGKLLHAARHHDRHVIMSRGEPGLRLYGALRILPRPPGVRVVYEAHRPCFTRIAAEGALPGPWRQAWAAWMARRVRRAERAVVEGADGVVCLTQGVREALAGSFRLTAPTLILPSGTTLPPEPAAADGARDIDVFYAGKLAERKGVHDLLRALGHLPDVRCWIAGGSDAEVQALQAEAEASGVASRVKLLGFVPPAETQALYERARVGVCPLPEGVSPIAERYTSPLKILNMMARGTPIVATDLPSVRELLDHERTALLAPPNDPPALAVAIRHLLDDRALARRLAAAAHAEVGRYTWDERARRLHTFLHALP